MTRALYRIAALHAHEILDSRGQPTIQATVFLEGGAIGTASVPSGASTGVHEAVERRDGDKKRYAGKGVLNAIRSIHGPISKALIGYDVRKQQEIDRILCDLDGTPNKKRFGANAILAVSLACAHASAAVQQIPLYLSLRRTFKIAFSSFRLPIPTMNVLNGGAHAGWVLDFQEFMIVPKHRLFRERLRIGAEVFHVLGHMLREEGYSTAVGDEGGYVVAFPHLEDALEILTKAVKKAGYKPGKDVFFALDPAVSELYDTKKKRYVLKKEKRTFTSTELASFFVDWVERFPILSLEDGMAEDDWDGWKELTERLGREIVLVGDDLFVTNTARLEHGIKCGVANAILIKVNQIGTLTETMEAIQLAQNAGYRISISHRSGETEDTTIADLAVAVNAEFIKSGSLSRSERLAKYNRLLEIEEELPLLALS